jgi:hypothetical protein
MNRKTGVKCVTLEKKKKEKLLFFFPHFSLEKRRRAETLFIYSLVVEKANLIGIPITPR